MMALLVLYLNEWLFKSTGRILMTQDNSTKTSIFGWKGVLFATICSVAFLAILYLAIGNEPDYMPSQQRKAQQQQMQMQGNEASQNEHDAHHSH